MDKTLFLMVDGEIVAHNKNGWAFSDARDFEKSIEKFLPDIWKSWTIFDGNRAICGRVKQ